MPFVHSISALIDLEVLCKPNMVLPKPKLVLCKLYSSICKPPILAIPMCIAKRSCIPFYFNVLIMGPTFLVQSGRFICFGSDSVGNVCTGLPSLPRLAPQCNTHHTTHTTHTTQTNTRIFPKHQAFLVQRCLPCCHLSLQLELSSAVHAFQRRAS